MGNDFFGPTLEGRHRVNSLFKLNSNGFEQDWEIEFADPDRLYEFVHSLLHGKMKGSGEDALVSLVIASLDEAISEQRNTNNQEKALRAFFKKRQDLRKKMLTLWFKFGCRVENNDRILRLLE